MGRYHCPVICTAAGRLASGASVLQHAHGSRDHLEHRVGVVTAHAPQRRDIQIRVRLPRIVPTAHHLPGEVRPRLMGRNLDRLRPRAQNEIVLRQIETAIAFAGRHQGTELDSLALFPGRQPPGGVECRRHKGIAARQPLAIRACGQQVEVRRQPPSKPAGHSRSTSNWSGRSNRTLHHPCDHTVPPSVVA